MNKRFRILVFLVVSMTIVLVSATAADRATTLSLENRGGSSVMERSFHSSHACNTHAYLLKWACAADRRDDYLVHRADCIYVTDPENKDECRAEAREAADEMSEECADVFEARRDLCDLLGQEPFLPDFDPADFVDPNDIGDSVDPNPYWPLTEGHTHVIHAEDEIVVLTTTDEVIDVGGIPCRVVRDFAFEEGEDDEGVIEYEAIEVTQDWYAQNLDGDIIYCGENTYEVEDGLIDNTDGSFAHLTDRALAGYLLRAMPIVGEGDRQEMASDEAEDYVKYLSLAATPSEDEGGDVEAFPCGGACLQTFELNPRDPGDSENKYYLPGTGFVLATKFEDGEPTGEREEVTCIGDSIDVLNDPDCEIADPEALFEALCAWAPEALCFD
ncbi:MAG: hypothetical protein OEV00_01885 [Acidobacteriota bacterium]|nr:hypothetical protein [Acidobacteriota bacterium]MDH3784057.1 hypothetical protein [Acidobacteriota bacterium]